MRGKINNKEEGISPHLSTKGGSAYGGSLLPGGERR